MANQSLITRLFETYKAAEHDDGEQYNCRKCDLKDALESTISADTKTHHPRTTDNDE